jgi:3-deoxy-D-manno-octulosonic-acid transferase
MSRNLLSPEVETLNERKPGGFVGEAALSIYGAAGRVGAPVAGALLRWRERQGKEDAARRGERLGVAGLKRPGGPLVWVHASSVGETIAALPLIDRLAKRGLTILLTTVTVTAAEVAKSRLPASALHQFVPIDTPGAVDRFLDHWQPSLALFIESELWPTMLKALHSRALPLIVINARMSERSFRSWGKFAAIAHAVLGRADLFLAQTPGDAERLKSLGAARVAVSGNLKFDVPPPPSDEAALAAVRRQIEGRPTFVAASTHPGEETAIVSAHLDLKRSGTRVLTILAPRHPERGDAVASLVADAGLAFGRRLRGDRIGKETEIYLVDTIGEMGIWYRVADVAFLGGSIVSRGGQNPIEPAKLMVPILHGPHVSNFRDVYDALAAADADTSVGDATALADAVKRLIQSRAERQRLAENARACVEKFAGALDKTLAALEPYLAALSRPNEASKRS